MTHRRNFDGISSCACRACQSSGALSRRQFLCTSAATAVAASTAAGTIGGAARAQQAGSAGAPGRPILIKGGCVLTLHALDDKHRQNGEKVELTWR